MSSTLSLSIGIPLVFLISFLWYEGGGKNSWARDLIIPIIVGFWFCFVENWIVGICVAGSCQIIRLGYGAYDPEHDPKPSLLAKLTKDRDGWWIRAISGAIKGLVAPLPILAQGVFIHLDQSMIWKLPAFVVLNAVSNFLVCRLRLNRLATDLIVGATFGTILFF